MTSIKNQSENFTGKENQFHYANQVVYPTFKSLKILNKKSFKNTFINEKSEDPADHVDDDFEFEFEKVTYIPNDKTSIIEITKEIEIKKSDDKQTPKRFEYGWGKTTNNQSIKKDEWGKPITKHNSKWQDELISINNAELERKKLEAKKMNSILDWGISSRGHLWGELFRNRTPKKSSSWGSRKWPEKPIENRIENGWKKLINDKKVGVQDIEFPPIKDISPTKRWGTEKLSVNPINRKFTVKRSSDYKAFEWAWGKADDDQMDEIVGWGKSSTKHDNDWQKEYKHQIENQFKEQKIHNKKISSNVEWGKNSKGFLWGELFRNRTPKKSSSWGSRKWPISIHDRRTFELAKSPIVQHHKEWSWKKLTTNQMPHKAFDWGLTKSKTYQINEFKPSSINIAHNAFDWGMQKSTMDHIKESKHQSNQDTHQAFDWGITKITMDNVNEFDKQSIHKLHMAFDWGMQKSTMDHIKESKHQSNQDTHQAFDWGMQKSTMDHIKESKHQSNQDTHQAFDWGITKITMGNVNEFDKQSVHKPHKAFDWGMQKNTMDHINESKYSSASQTGSKRFDWGLKKSAFDQKSKNPFVSKNDQILSKEWNKQISNNNKSSKLSSVKSIIENGKLLDEQAIKGHFKCENSINDRWRKSSDVNGCGNPQSNGWGKSSYHGQGWSCPQSNGWGKSSYHGQGWSNPQSNGWGKSSNGQGWSNPQSNGLKKHSFGGYGWGKSSYHGYRWSNSRSNGWGKSFHGNGWETRHFI